MFVPLICGACVWGVGCLLWLHAFVVVAVIVFYLEYGLL